MARIGANRASEDTANTDHANPPATMSVDAALTAAVGLHQSGNLAEAEALYRRILSVRSEHADALHYLGVLLHQKGDSDGALGYIRRSLDVRPDSPEFHCNLGKVLQDRGALEEALSQYRKAIGLNPSYAEAHSNLGVALKAMGGLEDAAEAYRKAIDLKPDYAEAYNNLGNTLAALGELEAAETALGKALALKPDYTEAYNNIGVVLKSRGRLDDAEAALRTALKQSPAYADAYVNLADVLAANGMAESAISACRRAIEIEPTHAPAHATLATLFKSRGALKAAEGAGKRAVELDPGGADLWNCLGSVLNAQGRPDEAARAYREALRLCPDHTSAHSNLLFCMSHDARVAAADFFAEARRWNLAHAVPRAASARRHGNSPDPERRLRVGYVSPDLCNHPMTFYLEPLFAAHDQEAVELYFYAEVGKGDAATARYKELADGWRPTEGLSASAVAEQVRSDEIDILVDLAGHTGGNRLLSFAERPAPVQVGHLLALGLTTGLDAMDYVLADEVLLPAGNERHFNERAYRLPRCLMSFEPSSAWPNVSPLPALAKNTVTFASFGSPNRITPKVIEIWARTLQAVSGAQLLLKHPILRDRGVQAELRAAFADVGVNDRVEIRGVDRGWAVEMDVYGEVDIALDTYPMGGGSTTCIALWMGVPVVTLVGHTAQSRFGLDFITAVGLESECAATSVEGYVARAAAYAANHDGLAELRGSLRKRMRASPLMDHDGLARAVEDAYRDMWREWCATSRGDPNGSNAL